jgi:hypothetical protein
MTQRSKLKHTTKMDVHDQIRPQKTNICNYRRFKYVEKKNMKSLKIIMMKVNFSIKLHILKTILLNYMKR